MRIGLSQSARMEQRLVQSPQMIQAMQILQLSALDLEARIADELLENPFLEVSEDSDGEGETTAETDDAAPEEIDPATLEGVEGMLEVLERYERDFGDGRTSAVSRDEIDRKFEAMQNTPSSYHSLGDALLDQIALAEFSERERSLAEYLVFSLDHRGYLPEPLESLLEGCPVPEASAEELQRILGRIQDATHPAIGALDLKQCLLLQIDSDIHDDLDTPLVRALIEHHLEDILANRIPRIARATDSSVEEVKQAIESIRTLDPIPGREYGELPAETIHPDVIVEEVDGVFDVRLTREGIPELSISQAYRKLLRQTARGDGVRAWIQKRLESARWFMDAVEQRQSTLLRIAQVIFERQAEFLRRGARGIVPLRMVEVAEATGVHISTVSRAVAGKYAQTPHGILPLRFFFSGGAAKESGGMASQASIKQRIKELIQKEDPTTPLSDDRIAELLREKDGIKIARRTITKYRKALQIPSSSQRRTF